MLTSAFMHVWMIESTGFKQLSLQPESHEGDHTEAKQSIPDLHWVSLETPFSRQLEQGAAGVKL